MIRKQHERKINKGSGKKEKLREGCEKGHARHVNHWIPIYVIT